MHSCFGTCQQNNYLLLPFAFFAGLGLIAEKRENLGIVLLFFVIPETLLIFGFVIAILVMLQAGLI